MRYEKAWRVLMNLLCVLVLGVALPAGAQTQGSWKSQSSQGNNVSALSLEEGMFGKDVKTRNGENVGEIDDVIFGNRGQIAHYLVNVGRGAGEKTVALSPDQLQFPGHDYAVFNGTRADLENMPEVNPYDFGVYGYYGPYTGPYGYRPSQGPGAYSRPYFDPYRDRYMSESYEQGPGGRYQERQGQEQQGGSSQSRQSYQQQYPRRGYYYGQGQGSMGRSPGAQQGQEYMSRGISGEVFLSAQVFTPRHENIGQVDDLVVDPGSGRITHAVIGLSDRQVLVPFNQLRYVGPSSVVYRGTERQLDQMPEPQVGEGGRVTNASISQAQEKAGGSEQQGGGQPQGQRTRGR